MATNVELNEKLITEAQRLGHHDSKRATIEEALKEYVAHRKQLEIKKLFGGIDYTMNHQTLRKRR